MRPSTIAAILAYCTAGVQALPPLPPTPQHYPLGSIKTPAVVSCRSERLDAFYIGTDKVLYWKTYDSTTSPAWTRAKSIGGNIASAPVVVANAYRYLRMDAFARGSNDNLQHTCYNCGDTTGMWRRWETIGGTRLKIRSKPHAISHGENVKSLHVFALGDKGEILHTSCGSNGGWTTWASMGAPAAGPLVSEPNCVSYSDMHMHCFALGPAGAMYTTKSRDSGINWTPWESLSGICLDPPTVVSRGYGSIDLFTRGALKSICHRSTRDAGQTWSDWVCPDRKELGGAVTPSLRGRGDTRIDLFAVGSGGDLLYQTFDGRNWKGWESRAGYLTSNPAAVSWSSDRIDVFGAGDGPYHQLFHQSWGNQGWSAWDQPDGRMT